MADTHETRLARARTSLDGLSVGDALGGFYEMQATQPKRAIERKLPDVEWHFTDDTNMSLSVYAILRQYQHIDADKLALSFAEHYERKRGYGMGARHLLARVKAGEYWRDIAGNIFGDGSYGNGGAMRAAPVGAYFADDFAALVENARRSSEITHSHPEGMAGAIAIAAAAGVAANLRGQARPSRVEFINLVLPHIPDGEVKQNCVKARDLPGTLWLHEVVAAIGNGSKVTAQDTVPFVLYMAGEYLGNYEESIWQTLSGGGDADTTCAMVGGIVALYTGAEAIPASWLKQREPLPEWAFSE